MSETYTKNSLTALSDLVGLNIYVLEGNQLVFAGEPQTSSAFEILGQDITALLPAIAVTQRAEYEIIENQYAERYSVFVLPDYTLLVLGPFLLEPINPAATRVLLREEQVPLEQISRLLKHYQTLPIQSRRFYQSLLALVEQMYPANPALFYRAPPRLSFPSSIPEHYQTTVAESRLEYRVRSPIALENRLLLQIEQGNWKQAKETLEDINSLDSAIFTTDPLQSKRYSLVAGCTLYTRAIIRGGIDYVTAFSLSDAMIRAIHSTQRLDDLVVLEYEMLEMFCDTIVRQQRGKFSPPVLQVMEYINANLTSEIILDAVGQAVGLDPNYVSNLFRKEVGTPLFKYIQAQRIEESKQLLLGTKETIAAISNFYQFCNEAYYIRIFKEHEGLTPNSYRQSHAHMQV